MSQLALNLVAIAIFLGTFTSLLGPLVNLSPFVPALATVSLLGLATLDRFQWQGQGTSLVLDFLAGFATDHRERVLRHEAGHFLVAYHLGLPVTGYALTVWEALQQGYPGQGGVRLDTAALEAEVQTGQLSGQSLDRLCAVWMAGIAAETLAYGNAQGGRDDREKWRALSSQLGIAPNLALQKERLALLRAKTLLQEQQAPYEALLQALQQRLPVEACVARLREG